MKISGIRQIKRAEIKVDIFTKNYKKWLSYYSILLFFWLKDEKWYYDLGLYEEKHFKNYRGFPFDLAAYVYDHVKEEARIIITLTDSYKLYFGLKNYKKVDERHSLVVRDANNDLICWIDITIPENEEKRP